MKAVALTALLMAGATIATLAAPACNPDALSALHVPDVAVTEAAPVVAAGTTPAHCNVHGTVATHGEGAPDGSAKFAMQLPDAWQQRFFSMGVGGNAGRLVPAVNATDPHRRLAKAMWSSSRTPAIPGTAQMRTG